MISKTPWKENIPYKPVIPFDTIHVRRIFFASSQFEKISRYIKTIRLKRIFIQKKKKYGKYLSDLIYPTETPCISTTDFKFYQHNRDVLISNSYTECIIHEK